MKMKKIYKILLLIAVCIIAVSGCKKEDKVSDTRITIQTQREFHWLRRAQESKERQKKRRLIMC